MRALRTPLIRAAAGLVVLATTAAPALWPAPALADTSAQAGRITVIRAAPPGLRAPASATRPPPGRRRSASEVLTIASRTAAFRDERAAHPGAYARAWIAPGGRWQGSLYAPPPRGEVRGREVAQVIVADRTGRALEAWTGVQVGWTMARGYAGAFGGAVNAPWLWLPLCLLFALPFLRPPWRLLHLDLAVLLAFSLSFAAFNAANLDVSVPSAYPLLLYVLVRMLAAARARGRRLAAGRVPAPPLRLVLSTEALALGAVALLGFRLALNVTNGNVIDVGFASVVGADRLGSGQAIYGAFPFAIEHGDTYGPALYAAYVPFEWILPWRGAWDALPAAHAGALAFDAGCALLLWLIGRQLRGPRLGALLAYLWLAYPFTLVVLDSGSNDALVALLVLAAVLAATRPAARGVLVGLAGMAKLAPLALAPLFVGAQRGDHARGGAATARAAAGFAAATGLCLAPVAATGQLASFWERTVGFQATRSSPFSLWGAHPSLHALQVTVQVAAVTLALAAAVWPRQRDAVTLAASAAAVLVAVQLGVEHWFYLYLVWFVPLVLIAVLAPYGEESGRSTGSIESAVRRSEPRITTALSQGSSSAAS